MQQIELDGLRKPVSRLVHGSTGLMGADESVVFPVLDAIVEAGVNAFDTAAVYASHNDAMDAMLGRWIQVSGARDEVVVIAKGAHPKVPESTAPRVTPTAVAEDIDLSCERMGVDYLDLWLFHRDDPTQDIGPLVEAVDTAIDRGHISA